jgi:hypothetical protein
MSKDTLNALVSALLGPAPQKAEEVEATWFLCVPDGSGGVQRYDTPNLQQVEITAREWLSSGWPVWVEDDQGRHLHLAQKPRELN